MQQVFPGKDGGVRQALERAATGVPRRQAVKLAVLDVTCSYKPSLMGAETPADHQVLRAEVCGELNQNALLEVCRNFRRNC